VLGSYARLANWSQSNRLVVQILSSPDVTIADKVDFPEAIPPVSPITYGTCRADVVVPTSAIGPASSAAFIIGKPASKWGGGRGGGGAGGSGRVAKYSLAGMGRDLVEQQWSAAAAAAATVCATDSCSQCT
jgi:hypothetical protein